MWLQVKFLQLCKDGGPESHVWAYILFEIKPVASVMLLRFENGTRDAFHSHAFNAVSWVLRGKLREHTREEGEGWQNNDYQTHVRSWHPIVTLRDTFHRVRSIGRTWVLTFRGPWVDTWREWTPVDGHTTLTHGRREVQPQEWELCDKP